MSRLVAASGLGAKWNCTIALQERQRDGTESVHMRHTFAVVAQLDGLRLTLVEMDGREVNRRRR